MLPKVETEAPGLARSHGEQGQMPENMQGKGVRCAGAPAPGFYTRLSLRSLASFRKDTRVDPLAVCSLLQAAEPEPQPRWDRERPRPPPLA